MADNITLNTNSTSGAVLATDDISSVHYPIGKTAFGALGAATLVTTTDGFPVQPATSTAWAVTDNSGSLTVDAPVGTPVFVRLSDGSAAISTLPVSLASVPSHAVTNAGTFAVQVDGSALTALQLLDDAIFSDDAAFTPGTSKVMVAGFEYDDTTPDSVDEGDAGAARMSARREVYVQLRDAAGNERGLNVDGSGNITVNVTGTVTVGSHAVTNAGTFAVQAAQSGTWTVQPGNTANTTAWLVTGTNGTFPVTDSGGSLTVDNAALSVTGGGVEASALRVTIASDSTGVVSVDDNGGALTVDNGGTFAVQESGAALTALQIMDDWDNAASDGASVSGDVAHDAADAGEPVKLGAKAESGLSGITLVADGDRTNLHAGLDGVLIVRNHTNLEDVVSERTTNTDGASTAFASGLAAPGAGVRLYITSVTLCNSSASFCTVDLRDGSAGSVLWTLPVPATGGVVQNFDPPLKLTANTALAFDASAATTTLTISANGFKSKV